MVKKDLNLFAAYKSGPHKPKSSGAGSLVATIILFALIVAGVYAGIYVMTDNKKKDISRLESQIAAVTAQNAANNITGKAKYNNLLLSYKRAITAAGERFDASRVLDSVLLDRVAAAIPSNMAVTSMNVTLRELTFYCESLDILAPAVFKQEADNVLNDIFARVSYQGVSKSENGIYSFTMVCMFKGDIPE